MIGASKLQVRGDTSAVVIDYAASFNRTRSSNDHIGNIGKASDHIGIGKVRKHSSIFAVVDFFSSFRPISKRDSVGRLSSLTRSNPEC